MSFNAAATRLAVSSSTRTIHIFDVSAGGVGVAAGERGRSGRRLSSSNPRQGSSSSGGWQGQEGDAENGANADRTGRRGSRDSDEAGAGVSGSGSSTSSSSLASGFRSVVGMLPNRVTKRMQDYVDCERSFASVRLRSSAGRSICALIPAGDSGVWAGRRGPSGGAAGGDDGNESGGQEEQEVEGEILLVVTSEGILYSYIVDTVNGGECRLDEASSLLMDPSASQEIGSELFGPERHAPPVVTGQS